MSVLMKYLYQNFCCGSTYRNNIFFKNNKNALQIQIFYDDFEVLNPLGSKTKIHKIGAIYFTIRNLPTEILSSLNNIHLLALFYVADITQEIPFKKILKPIIKDLQLLEIEGIVVDKEIIKGTLVSLSYDNLGANTILGFVQCFRAIYYCRFCTQDSSNCRNITIEDESALRNYDQYKLIFENNRNIITNPKSSSGIKEYCVLNDLLQFNMFDNPSVDIMHDVLEGAIPFAIKLIFKYIVTQKILPISVINDKINSFPYGALDKKNLPGSINLEKASSTSIGLLAIQNWTLFTYFPFIFFDVIPKIRNEYFLIQSLNRICKIIFSHSISVTEINELRLSISEHLNCVKSTFNNHLIPKHHFITHFLDLLSILGQCVLRQSIGGLKSLAQI